MKPTNHLRHVWRDISDGTETRRILCLQRWWEHDIFSWIAMEEAPSKVGEWRDVPISTSEPDTRPSKAS